MTRVLTDVDVRIVNRVAANGNPFTELLHTWVENGRRRNALSRVNYTVSDTPQMRAYHIESFGQRRRRHDA
ncbi:MULTISPECIES: hypothetical protein [unclassified Bradyrhizobium]|uniref:hypothetical protein n=1 Tax=unclassified Bradyrhizobium TaxID=2631580 RepID=UPI0029165C0E|nr:MULTISPECIES: hypothetical protein [unclassified Bradyrhizobium]